MIDLAHDTFLEKWPCWVRWLLIIPAAIVVPAIFALFMILMQTRFLGINHNALYWVLLRGVVYGYGFVFVGSYVAPKYQNIVAIILLVIVALLVGVWLFAEYLVGVNISHVIEVIINLISGGFAVYHVFDELK